MSKSPAPPSGYAELPFAVTLHVRDHCMCLHLQRAARAVARMFDEALRPYGLTNGQFSMLMALNRPEPPTIGDVAALLAMDRTTLTAMLKPLMRRGLAATTLDAGDRRFKRLLLLEPGRNLLAAALPAWKATEAKVELRLTESDADRVRADLEAMS